MSAEVVRQVYTNLAALPINFTTEDGDAVTVMGLDLSAVKNRVAQAKLPVRILAPIGPDAEARSGRYVALGTLGAIELYIADDLLLQPAQSGMSLEDIYPDLMRYCGAYWKKLRKDFRQPVGPLDGCRTVLQQWEMQPALITWGEVEYLGVHCKVVVQVIGL